MAYDIAVKSSCGKILGIDINEENISNAKKRFSHDKITYIAGDATAYTFEECYDVVILSNVLEHLTDRSVFLWKVKENIRPGKLLIRVPMYDRDWRVPLKDELGVNYLLDPTHELEYTTDIFEQETADAGLKISDSIYRWGELWCVVTVV